MKMKWIDKMNKYLDYKFYLTALRHPIPMRLGMKSYNIILS